MHPTVARVVVGQLFVVLASAAIWWILIDARAGQAASAGGVVALVPTLMLAWRMFSRRAQRSPQAMVRALYVGEAAKFALTVVLFSVFIPVFHANFLPLIITYILALMVSWFALFQRTG